MNYNLRRELNTTEREQLSLQSDLVAKLLFHRGIETDAAAENFLRPDYDLGTHDPFLLKDCEKAARRLIQAIKGDEKVAIYSDYDADGIPGAALFHDFFSRIGFKNFVIYIPHRHDEGFGVNEDAVISLAEQGVRLMITVDCGVTDIGPITSAVEKGIDVIVTDHHEPPSPLPPALAVVNHRQADCTYPDKNLCGSGVAFKLIQGVLTLDRFGLKEGHEKWLLDLVGMATLSDMVPLMGENRVLAHFGLHVLRQSPRKGLVELLSKLKIAQKHLTEDDLGYMITPRINAASRMGVPMDAFKLLTASSDEEARQYADHLDHINNERKGIVATLVKEIKKKVHERHGQTIPSVIVLGNPDWRPSLLGLAANSCAEEFDRPVFLWGRDGDNAIKGSCRSEGNTSVVELMRAVPTGIFSQFGGHHHSGGFAVGNENIHYLEMKLNDAATRLREKSEILNPKQAPNSKFNTIDAELRLEELDWALERSISQLAPFGVGNPKPVFLFRQIVPNAVKTFGKAKDHVEISFPGRNGSKIPAIAFFAADSQWAKQVKVGAPLDLIASIEKSMFRGRAELRLRVEEVFVQ